MTEKGEETDRWREGERKTANDRLQTADSKYLPESGGQRNEQGREASKFTEAQHYLSMKLKSHMKDTDNVSSIINLVIAKTTVKHDLDTLFHIKHRKKS